VKSIEEGVKVYRRFYSEEKEKKYGVAAIEVEPVGWLAELDNVVENTIKSKKQRKIKKDMGVYFPV